MALHYKIKEEMVAAMFREPTSYKGHINSNFLMAGLTSVNIL